MMKKINILKSLFILSFMMIGANVFAQIKVGPNSVNKSLAHVSNENNVLIDNYTTFANISSQTTLALLTTHGYIDLNYDNVIPANTNYFIRVKTNNNFLNNLLGGTVGGLLSSVLFGQHQLQVEAYNGINNVLDIRSNNFWTVGEPNPVNSNFTVWQAGDGFEYIKVTPSSNFNRIRLRDRTNPGLAGANSIDVYYAFYYPSQSMCDVPIFTSYTASGGLLDVLSSAPVTDLYKAIDNDVTNTSSKIGITSLLSLNAAGTVEQLFHLPGTITDKSVRLKIKMPSGLLKLNVANQSSIVFYNNNTEVGSVPINKSVLGLDLLGLVNQDNLTFSFAAAPRNALGNIIQYNKVGVRINKPLNINLVNPEDILVYDFAIINDKPVDVKVCTKEFITTVSGVDIRETKFNLQTIIPNYSSVNAYIVTNSKGEAVNVNTDNWQPLGSYVVKGITNSSIYCPQDNVSFRVTQDTQYRLSGKLSISLPLDANDDEIVDAQHTFNLNDYNVIQFGQQNTDVTSQYETIKIFSENDPLVNLMGTTVTFPAIGSYNFFVKTTNKTNTNCDLVRRVTVYVYDKAECNYRYQKLGANFEKMTTVSLLGIPLGGSSNSSKTIDSTQQEIPSLYQYDLSTHGSIFNVISLLGIGTTWQDLMFKTGTNITAASPNKQIPANTPLTVKLGQDYSALQVLGGITLQPLNTFGNPDGPLLSVDEFDLANVLVGDNVFEYTFIPRNSNGDAIHYSGVRINLGSVLGLGNTLKVYGAYIDERKAIAELECNPNIRVNGAEARERDANGNFITTLDSDLLLNKSTSDVLYGTKDIGLGVATALSSVLYPYYAADAIEAPGTDLHGTPDFGTGTKFNASVGALNAMTLTVNFKEIARPGDKVRIVLGHEGGAVLDASVLGSALSVQRYMGDVAIGDPVTISASSLIQLDLLSLINPQGTGKSVYMLEGIGAPFDRIQLQVGNIVDAKLLAPKLLVYDVSLLPYFEIESSDETTLLCTSTPFEIEKMDLCTSYELSFAYPTLVNGKITSWNEIAGSTVSLSSENEDRIQYRLQMKNMLSVYNSNGTLYMKVVTKRQGCIYGDAQYLKIKLASCGTISNPMIRTRLKSN